ncbi:uncharacterized protein LOC141830111 isoform X2 [Curcuma longa]|uniref:uncharacterized protein LOC141830111 isoform X2 n=1 Tax=Curcuma longa TaxID=136217 RepID=UPI003D9E9879
MFASAGNNLSKSDSCSTASSVSFGSVKSFIIWIPLGSGASPSSIQQLVWLIMGPQELLQVFDSQRCVLTSVLRKGTRNLS